MEIEDIARRMVQVQELINMWSETVAALNEYHATLTDEVFDHMWRESPKAKQTRIGGRTYVWNPASRSFSVKGAKG